MMYHCVLQVQSISLMSAASTAFILSIVMFITVTAGNITFAYLNRYIYSLPLELFRALAVKV